MSVIAVCCRGWWTLVLSQDLSTLYNISHQDYDNHLVKDNCVRNNKREDTLHPLFSYKWGVDPELSNFCLTRIALELFKLTRTACFVLNNMQFNMEQKAKHVITVSTQHSQCHPQYHHQCCFFFLISFMLTVNYLVISQGFLQSSNNTRKVSWACCDSNVSRNWGGSASSHH